MFFISVEVNAIIAQNPPKNSNKNSIFNRTCMNIGCIERASEQKTCVLDVQFMKISFNLYI